MPDGYSVPIDGMEMQMTRATPGLAADTFAKLRSLHTILGSTFQCGWPAYRQAMTTLYKLDGPMLDTLARLGHFHTTPKSVHFFMRA